jgi:chitinase
MADFLRRTKIKARIMGKKKKSAYKKAMKSLFANNKILWIALGGVATGIALSAMLGSEKAKEIADTVTDSVKSFTNKVKDEFVNQRIPSA